MLNDPSNPFFEEENRETSEHLVGQCESISDEGQETRSTPGKNVAPSRLKRCFIFYFGVASPIVCIVANALFNSERHSATNTELWQSGEAAMYHALLLHSDTLRYFYPLIGSSVIALGAWCFQPSLQRWTIVRILIWLGLILTIQFLLLSLLAHQGAPLFGAALLGLCIRVGSLCGWFWRRYRSKTLGQFGIQQIIILTAIVAVVAAIAKFGGTGLLLALPVWFLLAPLLGTLLGAPIASLVAFGMAANAITREASADSTPVRYRIWQWLAGICIWIGLYVTSWRFAILDLIDHYHRLPTQPSDCFVCSAAASGHRSLVRSEAAICAGRVYHVNRQMQLLKFLEFAIATACPRFHARLRQIYNRVGPILAAPCRRNKFLADAVYLVLVPVELISWMVARFLSIDSESIRRIYRVKI